MINFHPIELCNASCSAILTGVIALDTFCTWAINAPLHHASCPLSAFCRPPSRHHQPCLELPRATTNHVVRPKFLHSTISALNVEMISDFPRNVNQSGFVGSFQKRQVRQPRSPLRSWQPIAQSNDRSRRLDFQSRLQPPRKIKSLITVSGAMSVCSQTTNLQAAAPFTTANNFVSHDASATSRCVDFQRSISPLERQPAQSEFVCSTTVGSNVSNLNSCIALWFEGSPEYSAILMVLL